MNSQRPLPLRRRLLFAGVVFLAVAIGAEGGARMLGRAILLEASSPPPPPEDGAPNLQGNPYLLWEMVPGTRHEMGVTARINQWGLRGEDWTLEKPEGVRRIAALGDSSVFGFGVDDASVFTAVLEKKAGPSVQVLNSAVPGYSTFQTINLLQIRTLSFHPDLILVGCLWSDNNFDSFVDRDLLAAYSSFGNRHARRVKDLLDRSALFQVLDYKARVLRHQPEIRKVGWMVGRGDHIGPRRVELNDYARNLETIVELSHDVGAEVMFLVLANEEDVRPRGEGPAAWDPYRDVMRETAARHGAPLLDVPDLFRQSGLPEDQLFLDEMHPSIVGHGLIGGAVYGILEERGFFSGQTVERDPRPGPIPRYEDRFVNEKPAEPQPNDPAGQGTPAATGDGPTLSGTVQATRYRAGSIQVDVVDADASPPRVVGSARTEGPGPFQVRLGSRPVRVQFVAYLDENGDGPGPGDVRIALAGDPVPVPATGDLADLTLDLSTGAAVTTFATGSPGTPTTETTPAPTPIGNPDTPASSPGGTP